MHVDQTRCMLNRRRFFQIGSSCMLSPLIGRAACEDGLSQFGDASTAEEVTAGIDLRGKTALVTGINSGIGYETMRVLALRGAHVLGTARTEDKGRVACDSVVGMTTPLVLELSDFNSVVECADRVRQMGMPIDILICNAGAIFSELRQINGIEAHFVVNHLGHFILVNRLLDQVIAAPQGRIVIVGSRAHQSAPSDGIQFNDLSGASWFDRQTAYGHSKLANGLHSLELSRRLKDTRVTSNVIHPGVVQTNIARNLAQWQQLAFRLYGYLFLKNLEEGAATTSYVATHNNLTDVNGCYFADSNPVTPDQNMQDERMASRLWNVSERLASDYLI
jgi:NAD(P)-dependent dehydrogenase (short-subunit alcohol dehydrogenase family)